MPWKNAVSEHHFPVRSQRPLIYPSHLDRTPMNAINVKPANVRVHKASAVFVPRPPRRTQSKPSRFVYQCGYLPQLRPCVPLQSSLPNLYSYS